MNRSTILLFSILFALTGLFFSPICFASTDAKELNRQAEVAIKTGRHQEAIQLLKQAMKVDPKWGEPYYNAAMLLKLKNKRPDMMRALAKAHKLEPKNQKFSDAYSKVLKEDLFAAQKSGNSAEVNRLQHLIFQVNPSELEIGVEILNGLLKKGQTDKALQEAERILEANGHMRTKYNSEPMGRLFFIMANIEFEKGNILKARSNAENANKYSFANPEEPKDLLQKIKAKQSSLVDSLIKKAQAEKASGNSENAISLFKQAQEVDPRNDYLEKEINELSSSRSAKSAFAEVQPLIEKGSWLEARDMLEYIVSADPSNKKAAELLEKATTIEQALMKKLGRAEKLPRYSQERASMVEAYLRKGKEFKAVNNLKEAMIAFNRGKAIIELDSELKKYSSAFNKEVGEISAVNNEKDIWQKAVDARNTYEYEECLKLLKQLPRDYDKQLTSYLAEAYYKTGDLDNAKTQAIYQLSIQPENNRAKFVIGCINLDRGDRQTAYKYFSEISESDPDYPELSDKLIQSGVSKWKKVFPIVIIVLLLWIAWALYKHLPEYNKNSAIRKARSFLKKEMLEECINELNAVRRLPILTPYDGALISRILAQAYLKKGNYDRAIGECKHLISINPKDEDGHIWLGYAYLGKRMLSPESLPELLNLYQKDPKNIALVSLLGSHYTKQKNLSQDGVNILEQWLNLDPHNPEVLKPLGKFYLKKGLSDERSMKVFQKMMDMGSAESEFKLGVAKIHLKLRRFDECLKLCEEVINEDVNNELVHAVLRDTYNKQNRLADLLEIYRNFLQNNPYNVAFQNGLLEAQKLYDATAGKQESAPQEIQNAPVEVSPEDIICPHCSKPNNKDEYYCQHCGENLA